MEVILVFRGPRGILSRTSRIRGVIESIPRGIEEQRNEEFLVPFLAFTTL